MDLIDFPGGDLVEKGLLDLGQGVLSEEGLLLLVAEPRLRRLGFDIPEFPNLEDPYNHRLFEKIEERCDRGAHAAYNALIQRMVSFVETYGQAQRANRAIGGNGQI